MLGAKKVDATRGALVPLIISFVIPLVLTTLFQQLFNAVDIAVLGNMADTTAVAAVGATGVVIHLMVDAFVGISSGAKIVLSRLFGKSDWQELRRTIDTSLIVAIVFGVVVAAGGLVLAPVILEALQCPAECLEAATLYIRIYLMSAPAMMLYNYGAAILTSLGDSVRPLYYAIASGALNVVLNVVLCFALSQKVVAVAVATAAAQVLAAALMILRLRRLEGGLAVRMLKLRFNAKAFSQLMGFGIPLALQTLIYPLANIQITAAINSYGVLCVAGDSAASTMHKLTTSVRNAFGTAVATFMGQNIGVKRPERVRASLLHSTWLALAICLPVAFLEWLLGPLWLQLFLGQDLVAIEFAMIRVRILNIFAFFVTMNAVLGNAIQAFGYPIFSTLNAVVWVLGFRVVWMRFIYPVHTSYTSLIGCFVVSWMLTFLCNAVILGVIYCRYHKGKYKRI